MSHTLNIGINAAAIMINMAQRDFDKCGYGVVEQYENISRAAEFLAQHECALWDLLSRYDRGFPGVFAYEVSEELGGWMNGMTSEDDPIEFDAFIKAKAVELLGKFFLGNLGEPKPGTRDREAYDAVFSYFRDNFECNFECNLDQYDLDKKNVIKFELGTVDTGLFIGQIVYARNALGAVRKGTVTDVRVGVQAGGRETHVHQAIAVDVKFDNSPQAEAYARGDIFTSLPAAMGEEL